MKTVLIVEDEKLIRQGIRTMIQRSGVPVEVIIECSNGEMALEVLREQQVDVMFTDIRMPRMDGIELVKRMQDCSHVPLTVAVSGYDDFSYAVEMLRNGVREYILKPVEREKIAEVLNKLNAEIERSQEKGREKKKLDRQQIRHLLMLEQISEEELRLLEDRYEGKAGQAVGNGHPAEAAESGKGTWEFCGRDYAVCCQNTKDRRELQEENYIYLKDIEESDVFIVGEDSLELLLKNELFRGCTGISGTHRGLRELRTAYEEALAMRKRAFCRCRQQVRYGVGQEERIPPQLVQEAQKLLTPEAGTQRVCLLGTERGPEAEGAWQKLFFEVRGGRITEEEFEACVEGFFDEVSKTYRNILEEMREATETCGSIWREDDLEAYRHKFFGWISRLHEEILGQLEANNSEQKIRQAVEYIRSNFASDLNMAVVSNHISMNYSLFSYSFKQYTGSNFVSFLKDIRMKEAKRLLEQTDMRVNEISQAVGYDNEKHFMKLFKAACGVSPSEYRKSVRLGKH